jgi:hypothetical protein
MNNQPPVILYWKSDEAPKIECTRCVELVVSRVISMPAQYGPIKCFRHRNNAAPPTVGWAYITQEEVQLINILRRYKWTTDALEEMLARDHEAAMDAISTGIEDANLNDVGGAESTAE